MHALLQLFGLGEFKINCGIQSVEYLNLLYNIPAGPTDVVQYTSFNLEKFKSFWISCNNQYRFNEKVYNAEVIIERNRNIF